MNPSFYIRRGIFIMKLHRFYFDFTDLHGEENSVYVYAYNEADAKKYFDSHIVEESGRKWEKVSKTLQKSIAHEETLERIKEIANEQTDGRYQILS